MVKEASTKINRVGPRHTIYLQKDLVEDSTFPFHLNEPLSVRVEGAKLVIERLGKKSLTSDFVPNNEDGLPVLSVLDSLGYSPVLSRAERIYEMLKEVHEAETLDLRIKHIPPKEHAVFLWHDRRFLERVIAEFFDADMTEGAPKGLLSEKPSFKGPIDNRLYADLLNSHGGRGVSQQVLDWVSGLGDKNTSGKVPARIAIEDMTWFIDNGHEDEIVKFEKEVGERPWQELTLLCAYNMGGLSDEETLRRLLGAHSYVILDTPFRVYRKPK